MLVNDELFELALKERNITVNSLTPKAKKFKKSDSIKGCELQINYKNI
jgi:hypothetical protein|tara:strand:+ start:568 stop:711 length:144 start_codon:yes stop_codon:yes gene_type:complete